MTSGFVTVRKSSLAAVEIYSSDRRVEEWKWARLNLHDVADEVLQIGVGSAAT